MSTRVPLPTGSYVTQDPQASCKRLVGAFSEIMAQTSPTDSKNQIPPIAIRRMPGITSFASIGGENVVSDPATALLLHFDGTAGSTSFPDASQYGNVLTATGPAAIETTSTQFGTGALDLTGSAFNCGVSTPVSSQIAALLNSTADWTIELWFQFTQAGGYGIIPLVNIGEALSGGQASDGITLIATNGSVVQAGPPLVSGGTTLESVGTALTYGVWYHVALVRYQNVVTLYLNGVGDAGASNWGTRTVPANAQVLIGGAVGGGNALARIDEVRISTLARYTANFTPPTAPFVASSTTPTGLPATLPVRGFTTMAGVTYVVIGSSLYILGADESLTQLGTGILGNGFVRMQNNGACLVVLVPGTSLAWTYSLGGGYQQLTAPGFTQYGAIDMVFCDTFLVFLALNGRTLFTDDGQQASGQDQITFDTGSAFAREFGTDLFVGLCVDHREVVGIGALTSEGYLNAGNAVGSPLGSAPNSFMEIGAHPDTAYCIAKQDQAFMWIANDLTVRRRNDQTPLRISNSGIEAILAEAGPSGGLVGSYALTPSIAGHPLWVAVFPALQRTIAYDCLTTEWFELESLATGNWRPLCYWNAFGKQLVGDSVTSQIGYLDTTSFTEFGDQIVTQITTQAVFDDDNRITHDRLELVITCGGGTILQTDNFVTLYVSDDNGSTWRARETQSLGAQGQRTFRVFWTKLGQSRRRVYRFQFTSPTVSYTVAIIAVLSGGRW